MHEFIAGAITMGALVAGLFFMRFWRKTRDRLFLMFGLAFWMLAANRLALSCVPEEDEVRTFLYVIRLCAFLLILVAIIDKNRRP